VWIEVSLLFKKRFKRIPDKISEEEQKKISDELQNYVLESDLKREIAAAIKRLKEIKCYR